MGWNYLSILKFSLIVTGPWRTNFPHKNWIKILNFPLNKMCSSILFFHLSLQVFTSTVTSWKYTGPYSAPGHQYQQHWANIHYTGKVSYRNITFLSNYLRKWNYILKELTQLSKGLMFSLPLKSSPSSATYMHQWIRLILVQIMACRLFGAKPLSKLMLGYCQWDH